MKTPAHSLPDYSNTSTLLEDVFEPTIDPVVPICIVDFKVAAHFICNYAETANDVADGNEETLRQILRAMWAYRLNRGPDMLAPFPFTALITDDLKGPLTEQFAEASASGTGYWRHIEAHKLEMAEYKGGRGEKTNFFNLVQDDGYRYIGAPGSTFHYFAKEYFEADDIAGHVCRLKRAASKRSKLAKRQMILHTVDGDWQGLCSDTHGIYWANTGPWLPRLRSEREVCDYYLRKEGMHITSARGCYDFKVEYGDLGDNLYPGTPLRFFDLYEADDEWKFDQQDTDSLAKMLSCTTPSNRSDHMESAKMFLLKRGIFLPEIGTTWEEDKALFFQRAKKSREANSHKELKGKNRALCLEKISEPSVFEKCKELAMEDIKTHSEIKEETEVLRTCREKEDKKCVRELRTLLKGLKNLRISIKDQLAQLLGNKLAPDP